MSEQEDKPKPEGEQQQRARDEERVDEIVEVMKGKSDDTFSGKTFDELIAEIEAVGDEIIRLVAEDDDWGKIQLELAEKIMHLNYLLLEIEKRTKEAGDYKKWARALSVERQGSFVVEARNIKERTRLYKERGVALGSLEELKDAEGLKKIAKSKNLSLEEYFQKEMIVSLEQTGFYNFTSSAMTRMRSIKESIPALQFQAETAEVMLEVRKRLESSEQVQAKTANILEGVEGRLESSEQVHRETAKILEKVAENTNPAQQFILIVAASALVAISVGLLGDIIFLKWNDEIKEHWVAAILSVIVIGVFAILAIKKWVFGKN